nr:MAG TPA: protein of unknown function (DUF3599) [Caudoviricetes sp.]
MEEWKTPIQVEGRVRRDEDGYLVEETAARLIGRCLIAPGQFTVPGLLDQAASQRADETATLYLPRGVTLSVGDVIRVPAEHPLDGTWRVEEPSSPWPRGTAVVISRR